MSEKPSLFLCEKFAYFRIELVLGKMNYWIIMKCRLDLVKLITVRNFSSFCFLVETIKPLVGHNASS